MATWIARLYDRHLRPHDSQDSFPTQQLFILGTSHPPRCLLRTSNITDLPSYSAVVGQEELDSRSVNVRNRDDVGTKARTESMPLDVIVEKFTQLKETRSISNKLV